MDHMDSVGGDTWDGLSYIHLLELAAQGGCSHLVGRLLQKGATPPPGTCLRDACDDVCDGMADQCAASAQVVLRNAVCCGDATSVKAMLEAGVSTKVTAEDAGGGLCDTHLHDAANNGFKQVVQLLLDAGEDVNEADKHGMTALHFATRGGFIGASSVLIAAGANVDAVESECGMTPLHFAAKAGALSLIRLLLSEGAVLKKKNRDGDDARTLCGGASQDFNELLATLYSEMHGC